MTISPIHSLPVPLPPVDESPAKAIHIRKYRAAASTFLNCTRINELKKINQSNRSCSLPAEVLQSIFLACAQCSIDFPTWSWVEITNVCSAWRRAALGCWELWSCIDFSRPRWTFLTLYRSQMLPISVRATVKESNQHSIQRTIQYASRIRDLHLISASKDIAPLLQSLHSPNPYLESMIIDISKPDGDYDIQRPTSVRDSAAPSLKYLELHCAPFSLVSPYYTRLTHLSIHHIHPSERPSPRDFFSILKGFSLLQSLTLECAFPSSIDLDSSANECPVRLSKLLSISLVGSIAEVTGVLCGVALPAACQVHCHIDRMSDFESEFRKFAAIIGGHFHGASLENPLHTLALTGRETSIRFTQDFGLNPEFRQSLQLRAFGCTEQTKPFLDVVIGPDICTCRDEVLIGAVELLWEALPLGKVDTMALQGLDIMSHRIWQKLLPTLRSLRVMDLCGYAPFGLLWALLLNARSHSRLEHEDKSKLLLPKINDIYLRNLDCVSGGLMVSPSGAINSHCDLDDSRFLDVLLAYLEDRQRCNLELRCVSLSRCQNVSREVLNNFKDVVGYLAWDGRGAYKLNIKGATNSVPAVTYRPYWSGDSPPLRHYYRLERLLELD